MKLFKLFILSILVATPLFGMKKEEKPLLFDKTSDGGLLPSELHEELKKFITNNGKDIRLQHLLLKQSKKNNYNQKLLSGNVSGIMRIGIYSEKNYLFVACHDGTIEILDLSTNGHVATLVGHMSHVVSFALNVEENELYSSDSGGCIKIWDLNTKNCIGNLTECTNVSVFSLIYNPTLKQLYSSSDTIKIWDIKNRKCIATLENPDGYGLLTMAHVPKTNRLYAGSMDHAIRMWDLNTHSYSGSLKGHTNYVLQLIYNPSTNQLYSTSNDGTIKIWNLDTHECIATLKGHNDSIYTIEYNPALHQLYSASEDFTIKIWDLSTYSCIATLQDDTIFFSLAHNQLTNKLYASDVRGKIKILQLYDPALMQELKKASALQLLALQKICDAFDPNLFALLKAGNANLSLLEKEIKDTVQKKPLNFTDTILIAIDLLFAFK